MRYSAVRRLQLIILSFCTALVLGIFLIIGQRYQYIPSWDTVAEVASLASLYEFSINRLNLEQPHIVLISGHAGFDSGAICTEADGHITLTEVEVNASIAEQTADRLGRSGFTVSIVEEYDERLNGLEADLLLSLHSDSCIDASGFKAARYVNSPIADQEDRFLTCLNEIYSQETGLAYHPNTLTHDMLEYHAFRRVAPQTPAIILEMGFLGGDGELLSGQGYRVARGITGSVHCFMNQMTTE
ncbi:MAG: N-acetylmuramoyl-L-alanine amidase [Chloroflexota bacterium]